MKTLADIFKTFVDDRAPTAFRAYDGSVAGPKDAMAVVEIRSPLALRYVLSAPCDLVLARAYVTGALDVRDGLHAGLRGLLLHARRPRPSEILRALRRADRHGFRHPPVPEEKAPPRWRRGLLAHTKERDAAAIAHHFRLEPATHAAFMTAPDHRR